MDKTANTAASPLDEVQKKVVGFLTDYGIQIIGALIILAIGALIARSGVWTFFCWTHGPG